MSYRKDSRTKEEFQRDISEGIQTERHIIWRWLDKLEKETGYRPDCQFNGCAGADIFLLDEEVSTEADYLVEGYGKVEIKFSRPSFTRFHLKISQLESYVKQDATILMVNGWSTDEPKFTLISPETMEKGLKIWPRIQFKGFGGKLAARILASNFIWRSFNEDKYKE